MHTDFRLVHQDADGCYAVWRNTTLLQVRWGKLTLSALQALVAPMRALLAATSPIGFLVLVEAGAPIPSEEVRQQQRALLDMLLKRPTMRMAAVTLGDDVSSALARSAGRMVAVGNPHIQRFSTIPAGAQWLSQEMAALGVRVSAAELVVAIEQLREPPPASGPTTAR